MIWKWAQILNYVEVKLTFTPLAISSENFQADLFLNKVLQSVKTQCGTHMKKVNEILCQSSLQQFRFLGGEKFISLYLQQNVPRPTPNLMNESKLKAYIPVEKCFAELIVGQKDSFNDQGTVHFCIFSKDITLGIIQKALDIILKKEKKVVQSFKHRIVQKVLIP